MSFIGCGNCGRIIAAGSANEVKIEGLTVSHWICDDCDIKLINAELIGEQNEHSALDPHLEITDGDEV